VEEGYKVNQKSHWGFKNDRSIFFNCYWWHSLFCFGL